MDKNTITGLVLMGVVMFGGMYEGKVDLLTHCFRWGGAELMMTEVQANAPVAKTSSAIVARILFILNF